MAPSPITEDYYMVLGVHQTANPGLIVTSYKRLALKLHPDRNHKHDATEAFQLLSRAYETLRDESKRRAYDLIYPSITRRHPSHQTQTPRPSPSSTAQSEVLSDAAQIAALQRSKQERGIRWWTTKNAFDSSIFELQRGIQRLEQEIKNLESIAAAEAATEAQKNSWGTWLLSPIYKKADDSEEEKAGKDRERQERRIEKDMKERRLETEKEGLEKVKNQLRKAKEEVDAANLSDDRKTGVIQDRIWAKIYREKQEREKVERERLAKILKQQQEQREKWEREAVEAAIKQQAEKRAAERKRQEEETRKWQNIIHQRSHLNPPNTHQAYTSICRHDGWWPKVQGRTACPECFESWTYLLQCPGCELKACPRCQSAMRPRIPRGAARTSREDLPRVRTATPNFYFDYD